MSSPSPIQLIQRTIPASVALIAVSKTVSVEKMRLAYDAGIRDFGESRLQEALPKLEAFRTLTDVSWHFIGHLQANKVRKVVENFKWIHAVDTLALVQRIDRVAQDLGRSPNICLQVKLLPDPDKFGWSADSLRAELPALEICQTVAIKGLMTILPQGLTADQQFSTFCAVKDLAAEISAHSQLQLSELSMGMSGDYLQAIAAGSTMVRLGRILFGERTLT